MKKTRFFYQKYFLRAFCVIVIVPIAAFLQYLFDIVTTVQEENFWFTWICDLAVFAGVFAYFKSTEKCRLFLKKGAYWVEDGTVFLEVNRKAYRLNSVKAVYGMTTSYFGFTKVALLKIETAERKLTLASPSIKRTECFSDSILVPLLETILENNPQLRKNTTVDFYYVS